MAGDTMRPPVTPDGRYFVVRGRLWRCTDPRLPPEERERLTRALMRQRTAIGRAMRTGDAEGEAAARRELHALKVALGERGPVWWTDGAPDLNRRMARNTPYAGWHAALEASAAECGAGASDEPARAPDCDAAIRPRP